MTAFFHLWIRHFLLCQRVTLKESPQLLFCLLQCEMSLSFLDPRSVHPTICEIRFILSSRSCSVILLRGRLLFFPFFLILNGASPWSNEAEKNAYRSPFQLWACTYAPKEYNRWCDNQKDNSVFSAETLFPAGKYLLATRGGLKSVFTSWMRVRQGMDCIRIKKEGKWSHPIKTSFFVCVLRTHHYLSAKKIWLK